MATLLEQAEVGPEPTSADLGRNPWALAGRRLRRNRIALAALGLFLLIVLLCLAAPLYAHDVAHVNPFPPNLNGHTVVNGKVVPVMQQGGGTLHLGETPIGPTWDLRHYFLGADSTGRDIGVPAAVRRAELAAGRDRLGRPVLRRRHRRRPDRRLLRRRDRHAAVPADGRHLGLPGLPAGHLARDRAAHPLQRVPVRAAAHQRDQPVDAHGHHRVHLRAVRLPPGPRPGALGGQQGVRGGRRSPRARATCG